MQDATKIHRYIPPAPRKKIMRHPDWTPARVGQFDLYFESRTGAGGPNVPTVDPDYVLRADILAEISYAAFPPEGARPMPVALVGPKGSGKTSAIEQLAARLNIEVYRINCNVGTSVRHLKGKIGAKPGETVHYDGIAVRAMESGAWLILDEISGVTPSVGLALFPILEHNGAVLIEDAEPPRYVKRHPDFRVFATDNTIGAAQEENSFGYAGTNREMNEALLDRFGSFVEVDYLGLKAEHGALMGAVPNAHPKVAEGVAYCMSKLRASGIGFAFSTRMSINWLQRATVGYRDAEGRPRPLPSGQMLEAANHAFLNSMPSENSRTEAVEIISRIFRPTPGRLFSEPLIHDA